jgi:2-haloacid dehalogenase
LRGELERLFDAETAARMLDRYHELEPTLEADYRPYREVLTLALERLAETEGTPLRDGEPRDALARSLPGWRPFPEVQAALLAARQDGWKLAILSNTDRDLIEASLLRLGVPFDHTVVAEDVRSYKPRHAHWERFFTDTTASRERHVHVAASQFHDIAPARALGLRTIWINRDDEPAGAEPDRELRNLALLPPTLNELVAA